MRVVFFQWHRGQSFLLVWKASLDCGAIWRNCLSQPTPFDTRNCVEPAAGISVGRLLHCATSLLPEVITVNEIGRHCLPVVYLCCNYNFRWRTSGTNLGMCTHQCDETQGNSSARALSTKIVFFGCKKIDNNNKKGIKEEDREGADVKNKMLRMNTLFVSVLVLIHFQGLAVR